MITLGVEANALIPPQVEAGRSLCEASLAYEVSSIPGPASVLLLLLLLAV